MTVMQTVLWGCLGGLLPDVLRPIGLRYKGAPDYLTKSFFWFGMVLLVAVAGLTAYLLSPTRIIDAIALGFSAPEILSKALGANVPRQKIVKKRDYTSDGLTHYRHHNDREAHVKLLFPTAEAIGALRRWWLN